jgi:hypothetical protein
MVDARELAANAAVTVMHSVAGSLLEYANNARRRRRQLAPLLQVASRDPCVNASNKASGVTRHFNKLAGAA